MIYGLILYISDERFSDVTYSVVLAVQLAVLALGTYFYFKRQDLFKYAALMQVVRLTVAIMLLDFPNIQDYKDDLATYETKVSYYILN